MLAEPRDATSSRSAFSTKPVDLHRITGEITAGIREYAEEMVPVIREYDSEAAVLCGTHGWASLDISDGESARDIVDNPVDSENFM